MVLWTSMDRCFAEREFALERKLDIGRPHCRHCRPCPRRPSCRAPCCPNYVASPSSPTVALPPCTTPPSSPTASTILPLGQEAPSFHLGARLHERDSLYLDPSSRTSSSTGATRTAVAPSNSSSITSSPGSKSCSASDVPSVCVDSLARHRRMSNSEKNGSTAYSGHARTPRPSLTARRYSCRRGLLESHGIDPEATMDAAAR